ncbi:uncharacterized protein LOC143621894 [Bidens hawaiensis]|uniref:uncharacterized protein LOC143621894 n=1 Tax=Bidens hawaiensis TaxID=980011 RepID=UPI004049187E
MATMRNLRRLATTGRAAASFSTVRRHSILPTALYTTSSYAPQPHRFSSHDRITGGRNCVGCNLSFSTAASVASEPRTQSDKTYVPNDVVLYQYQACPFCNKVKAFLEYYDIPYKIVEVNPMNKKEIKWSDYRKVPIWWSCCYVFVSKKLKKRHNITDERKALYEAAETWVNALNGRQYLGGSEPNLADLSVFGVLRPIRELKSGKDMVENTRIGEWFTRMESQMKPHRDTALQSS